MLAEGYWAVEGDEREAYLEGLSPDELLDLGRELYGARHYWNAHEAWEQVWLDAPRELRAFYQGLIQVTAAFVHVTRGEYPGSVRLLEAGIDKLSGYESPTLGVDVSEVVEGSKRALARLVELGERRVREFDMGLAPRIRRRG
jgi:predicted metal-dependent hydrolase